MIARKTIKQIAIPWVYVILLLFGHALTIGLGHFISTNHEHRHMLCAGHDKLEPNRLLEEFQARHPEITADLLPTQHEDCQGPASELTFEYQGSHFGYMKRQDTLYELFDQHTIRTHGFTLHMRPDRQGAPIGIYALLLLGTALFLGYQRRVGKYVSSPGNPSRWPAVLIRGATAGLLCLALVQTSFMLLADTIYLPKWTMPDPADFQLTGSFLILVVVMVPIFEEIVFRAWLLEAWRKTMPPALALALTSVAFSLMHPMGVVANLIFIIPGLIFGWLWLTTRSLTACVVAHGLYNALVLSLISIQL